MLLKVSFVSLRAWGFDYSNIENFSYILVQRYITSMDDDEKL